MICQKIDVQVVLSLQVFWRCLEPFALCNVLGVQKILKLLCLSWYDPALVAEGSVFGMFEGIV